MDVFSFFSPVSQDFPVLEGLLSGRPTSVTVINEVIVAGLLGDGRGRIWDLNVFQVKEAKLDFHAEQGVQVVPCQVTHHVFPQQRIQPVGPDTVLVGKDVTMMTTGNNYESSSDS